MWICFSSLAHYSSWRCLRRSLHLLHFAVHYGRYRYICNDLRGMILWADDSLLTEDHLAPRTAADTTARTTLTRHRPSYLALYNVQCVSQLTKCLRTKPRLCIKAQLKKSVIIVLFFKSYRKALFLLPVVLSEVRMYCKDRENCYLSMSDWLGMPVFYPACSPTVSLDICPQICWKTFWFPERHSHLLKDIIDSLNLMWFAETFFAETDIT